MYSSVSFRPTKHSSQLEQPRFCHHGLVSISVLQRSCEVVVPRKIIWLSLTFQGCRVRCVRIHNLDSSIFPEFLPDWSRLVFDTIRICGVWHITALWRSYSKHGLRLSFVVTLCFVILPITCQTILTTIAHLQVTRASKLNPQDISKTILTTIAHLQVTCTSNLNHKT